MLVIVNRNDEFIGGLERTDELTVLVEQNTGHVIGDYDTVTGDGIRHFEDTFRSMLS